MNEAQIRDHVKFLLHQSGWEENDILNEEAIIYEDRVLRIDIILLDNFSPLAVIETKSQTYQLEAASEQAKFYAEAIKTPFAFITDGKTIIGVKGFGDNQKKLESFPSINELRSLLPNDFVSQKESITSPFFDKNKSPSYYQVEAIRRCLNAIQQGKKRILISMVQGSGKTIVAAEIAWQLIHSKVAKRILWLSYYKELSDQIRSLLNPVSTDITFLSPDKPFDKYKSIHIGTVGFFTNPEKSPRYKSFSPEFFDVIILPEIEPFSHYLPILEYFNDAIVIGFTNRELPGSKITQFFGQPVFLFLLEEYLALQEPNIPEGFKAEKLSDIAHINIGIQTKNANAIDGSQDKAFLMISGRDILNEGQINFNALSKVNLEGTRIFHDNHQINEQYLIKPNDILISSFSSGKNVNVAFIPENVPALITFSNSLIRVRVVDQLVKPTDVYSFLKSDSGQIALRGFASRLGSTVARISPRDLGYILVYLPKALRNKAVEKELSILARVEQQLREEILPEIQDKSKQKTEPNEQELELVAGRLHQLATLLSPAKLEDKILSDFPTPISLAFRRYYDSRFNIYERVLRLRDVFESIGYFIYSIVLADALQRLDPIKYFIEDKGARRAYNGFSMSSRMDFVGKILEIAKSNLGKDLFFPELVGTSLVKQTKDFQNEFRNRLSHTATAMESQQKKIISEFEPELLEMLTEIEFITNYRLVRVPSLYFHKGQLVRRMEVYRGVVPNIEEEIIAEGFDAAKADHEHIVLMNTENQILDLHPIYQLLASEETRHETHLSVFKQRKFDEKKLTGESVQGAYPVILAGFDDFELLQNRILDKLPKE